MEQSLPQRDRAEKLVLQFLLQFDHEVSDLRNVNMNVAEAEWLTQHQAFQSYELRNQVLNWQYDDQDSR